jgi:hypothetical protein
MNAQVLLLQLLAHEIHRVVYLQRGSPDQGFFGILRIAVPSDQRARFDAGHIPSSSSARLAASAACAAGEDPSALRARAKSLVKIWETAGLRESAEPGGRGALFYVFDHELHSKQRKQQATGRSAKRFREEDSESAGKRQAGTTSILQQPCLVHPDLPESRRMDLSHGQIVKANAEKPGKA